jgi:hypothetical protein
MWGQVSVATIYPAFDNRVVHAGQNVTGKVYLFVHQEEVDCTAIGCRIIGQEFTSITQNSQEPGESSTTTATERRRFMDLRVCLHRPPDAVIRPGQFEFPFSFTVPASAPATTYVGDMSDCAFINYTMDVWLDRPGSLRGDIRSKSTVIVVPAPVAYARTPLYIQPQAFNLRSLFMFSRGNALLSAQVESNLVCAGGTTSIKLAVSNLTSVPIQAVVIKLTQSAKFTALRPRGIVYHGTSVKKLVHTFLTPQQLGLDDSRPLRHQDQDATLRQLGEAVCSEDCSVSTPTCTIRIPIPLDAASSYQNGDRFSIRHDLKIKVVTAFGTCNPWITQQIYVVNPAPVYIPEKWLIYDKCSAVPQLPPNWAQNTAAVAVLPEIPVDMGALGRPGVKLGEEDEHLPFQYAATAYIAPAGYPNVGVQSFAAPTVCAPAAVAHISNVQAVGPV